MGAHHDEFGKVAVLMGGPSAEREISFLSGNAVLAALREKGVDAHAFDPKERPLSELAQRALRSRVHRAARPLRRGRHRAGRAGDDGHPVHRQRRDGLGAGDGQVAHQARVARERHPDAALRRRRRAHRLDARRRRAGLAADREAGARRLDDRHHEGRPASITASSRSPTTRRRGTTTSCWSRSSSPGMELTASILGDRALPLIRIEAPGGNYDYHNKYFSDETKYFCPCGLAAAKEAGDPRRVARGLPHRRLPRLGPARPHPEARTARSSSSK